jgi:putative flavoprotein involved in K+ transport
MPEERQNVVVIGAGQAGLSVSHELTERRVEHVILERGRIGETWRGRWDSFCLVTPNWATLLPGMPYDGDDPDGYMPKIEIVGHLERYSSSFGAPVREGVGVESLRPSPDGDGFDLRTSAGEIHARAVVVSTGAYQRSHRPAGAETLPADLLQIDIGGYSNPSALPDGSILVVGSGQSGCQIAEELHEAGREVVLACGRAGWVPRRAGDRDIIWWMVETGFMDVPVTALPSPQARLWANPQATGHGGGHDLHTRTLQAKGVTLTGHFLGAEAGRARFAPDLAENVAWGDERFGQLREWIMSFCARTGIDAPEIPTPPPVDASSAPVELDLRRFGAVIFAGGFRPDYGTWVNVPGAFDDMGFPIHHDGESTVAPGLHFVGVHFLRTRRSSLLCGVGKDAEIVANQIAARE